MLGAGPGSLMFFPAPATALGRVGGRPCPWLTDEDLVPEVPWPTCRGGRTLAVCLLASVLSLRLEPMTWRREARGHRAFAAGSALSNTRHSLSKGASDPKSSFESAPSRASTSSASLPSACPKPDKSRRPRSSDDLLCSGFLCRDGNSPGEFQESALPQACHVTLTSHSELHPPSAKNGRGAGRG